MNTLGITSNSGFSLLKSRVSAYSDLIKFRLSALVTFSAVFGYILGDRGIDFGWSGFIGLVLGGFLFLEPLVPPMKLWSVIWIS